MFANIVRKSQMSIETDILSKSVYAVLFQVDPKFSAKLVEVERELHIPRSTLHVLPVVDHIGNLLLTLAGPGCFPGRLAAEHGNVLIQPGHVLLVKHSFDPLAVFLR